jgi:radical SAM-linked protein
MAKLFSRALRRAGIPVKYSLGYHPMPKIAFGDTLPMGMQSESERLYLTLSHRFDSSELASRLQIQLPEGFGVLSCTRRNTSPKARPEALLTYHVELKDGIFNATDLEWFSDQPVLRIDKTNKKGKHVAVDLKKSVTGIELIDDRHALISLTRYSSQLIRPAQILKTVFKKSEQEITAAIITKCKSNHV